MHVASFCVLTLLPNGNAFPGIVHVDLEILDPAVAAMTKKETHPKKRNLLAHQRFMSKDETADWRSWDSWLVASSTGDGNRFVSLGGKRTGC